MLELQLNPSELSFLEDASQVTYKLSQNRRKRPGKTILNTKFHIRQKCIFYNGWECQNQEGLQKHKITHLDFLINSIQTGVKSVCDRGYRGNLHQFQCYKM